jgi:hypothetical protein
MVAVSLTINIDRGLRLKITRENNGGYSGWRESIGHDNTGILTPTRNLTSKPATCPTPSIAIATSCACQKSSFPKALTNRVAWVSIAATLSGFAKVASRFLRA